MPIVINLRNVSRIKRMVRMLLIVATAVIQIRCSSQHQEPFQAREVYRSKHLVITQVTGNAFVHTSFLQTSDFGTVPCNGLVVRDNTEAVVFDTPANDKDSEELIAWIRQTLQCKVNAVIPTHFHNDCLGGLNAFHKQAIPSYASFKTIALATEHTFAVPQIGFRDSLSLTVGDEKVSVRFFGEGHTKDNVVGYFPGEHVMFGGCLIKELNAAKGYLGDANVKDWPATVEKVKMEYPDVKVIVPGHGEYGDKKLLDYTISLFRTH